MKLNNESLKDKSFWEKAGISLPVFNREAMIKNTEKTPKWVHFGPGNIFRAFPASLAQSLLEKGFETTGIIAAEGYDEEIIDKCFDAHDNLTILVILKSDGSTEKRVISSVSHAYKMSGSDFSALKAVFSSPSLQMATFTITEKGYSLKNKDGELFPHIAEDIKKGPENADSYLGRITALCHHRFKNGKLPLAMVSIDNCSHNGDILFNAVETIAKGWVENKTAEPEFLDYVRNKEKLSFPWTMIDKITPYPAESVRNMLISCGLEAMEGSVTKKNTYIAPFVNAEEAEYLVIEDSFPNGRPALEKAADSVFFTDRETVDKVEKMKVCTCLNPLHTGMAIFGCLLGYTKISDEMKDADIIKLIEGIGYTEGLPVVIEPGIINPRDFIDQVIKDRLPNPFLPDTPQRIAMDTSLKMPIRFGETIKAYIKTGKSCKSLKFIPLVFAGWLRYLLGIDDNGNTFELSPDPNNEILIKNLSGIGLEQPLSPEILHEKLKPILSNPVFFGVNLYEVPNVNLGKKVEDYFVKMIEGKGAVRNILKNI